MNTRGKKSRHLIKTLVAVGVALFFFIVLLMSLYQNYDFLQEQHMTFSPVQFCLSLLPLVLSYLFIPSMWCSILGSLGVSLPYRKAFCIQYLSHLGRYIPGKIWTYIAQSYLASQAHVSLAETLYSSTILMCLMNLSSLLVFALSFLAWDIFTFFIRLLLVSLSFLLICFLFRMHWLERGVNTLIARITRLSTKLRCNSLCYTPLVIEAFLSWSVFAIGFHIMITSFYTIETNKSLIIVGTFSISWLAGYYAFLVPGGLGIQEGIQVYMLAFFFPLPISIVIALASRLWMTLGDIIVFLLAAALTIQENRLQRSAHESYL